MLGHRRRVEQDECVLGTNEQFEFVCEPGAFRIELGGCAGAPAITQRSASRPAHLMRAMPRRLPPIPSGLQAARRPAPIPEIPKIEQLLCFFNEKVDIVVDGVAQPRPQSPWS